MNTVILIILSLFATIGIAFLIDAAVKSILYDKSCVADMEVILSLSGDSERLPEMLRIFVEDTFTYKTINGFCKITVIDKGLSKLNQENMDNIAHFYDNVRYIKGN